MGAELWLLLRRPPQPPGPWGASKGPEPIARRSWDKRRDKKSHFFFSESPTLEPPLHGPGSPVSLEKHTPNNNREGNQASPDSLLA